MLREMGEALDMLSAGYPTVLLLEDLHWGDTSSIDLIPPALPAYRQAVPARDWNLSARRTGGEGSSSVKNHKREMEAHGQCKEIALGMLSQNHVSLFLDACFMPNEFPVELALIKQKTEGHPLFTTAWCNTFWSAATVTRVDEHSGSHTGTLGNEPGGS